VRESLTPDLSCPVARDIVVIRPIWAGWTVQPAARSQGITSRQSSAKSFRRPVPSEIIQLGGSFTSKGDDQAIIALALLPNEFKAETAVRAGYYVHVNRLGVCFLPIAIDSLATVVCICPS
jgi:hypothetical protein